MRSSREASAGSPGRERLEVSRLAALPLTVGEQTPASAFLDKLIDVARRLVPGDLELLEEGVNQLRFRGATLELAPQQRPRGVGCEVSRAAKIERDRLVLELAPNNVTWPQLQDPLIGPFGHMRIVAPEHLAAARALATDAATAEVVASWRDKGIESVLLKGPSVVDWLYPGEPRGYDDADLLIAPASLLEAVAVLHELCFTAFPQHLSSHAHPWVRARDGTIIDLHTRLWWGPRLPPEQVWRQLQGWLQPCQVGGGTVNVLNLPGRALSVALHAAHDPGKSKPREDLRRALARTPIQTWSDAERLADRIGALLAMGDGLGLEPEGGQVVEELPLVRAAVLGNRANAPLAVGLARFSLARGPRAKLRVFASALGQREDLIGARRLLSLLVAMPRTVLALRTARRRSRQRAPRSQSDTRHDHVSTS